MHTGKGTEGCWPGVGRAWVRSGHREGSEGQGLTSVQHVHLALALVVLRHVAVLQCRPRMGLVHLGGGKVGQGDGGWGPARGQGDGD